MMVNRSKVPLAMAMLILIGVAFAGCSRETRHEILTIFFTGVPPLDADAQPKSLASRPAPGPSKSEQLRQAREARKRQAQLLQLERAPWAHGPFASRQCGLCHASMRSGPRARTGTTAISAVGGRLVVPREELCLQCHTTKSTAAADEKGLRLHGPVASGLCVACHHPHQTARRYMLHDKDNATMCTRCHDPAGIRARSPVHGKGDIRECLECHDPHWGRTAMILKPGYDESGGKR